MMRAALVGLVALVPALPAAAAAPPTIVANASVVGSTTQLVLSGTVPSGAAGETVQIEAKECGGTFFRIFAGATTGSGGAWTHQGFINGNTSFRARWKDAVSGPIDVKLRTFVSLTRRSGRVFAATTVTPFQRMVGKVVRLERHTPAGWVLVRTGKLKSLAGPAAQVLFRVRQRGLQLRVLVPDASARPCYVAGVSPIVRS